MLMLWKGTCLLKDPLVFLFHLSSATLDYLFERVASHLPNPPIRFALNSTKVTFIHFVMLPYPNPQHNYSFPIRFFLRDEFPDP